MRAHPLVRTRPEFEGFDHIGEPGIIGPESIGSSSRGAPVARAVRALVVLDTTPVVPAPRSRFVRPLDLLTGEVQVGPPGGPSEPETLSPSRLVVNPEVARGTEADISLVNYRLATESERSGASGCLGKRSADSAAQPANAPPE